MPKIKLLPEKVINQIAAGEVVERPSSVVKELVENALDARTDSIEVEVEEGGLKLIKVTDRGEGMTPEDAHLAVQKHATSKIQTTDDLSRLHSFGFRGEALASIASVSNFELSTRTADSLSGISIKVKGGAAPKAVETGRPVGTTVTISNLFFNTPARLKFMKKQTTEENHIHMVVMTYALAFPQVGFKLTLDGKQSLSVTPSDRPARLSAIFGKDLARAFLPVSFDHPGLSLSGVVSAPTVTKPTRENMVFFVNDRWIANPSLGHAVMTAFHTLLPTRRFPVSVLFLKVPEDQVDVNVHPTKKEVKFAKDREIYDAIVRSLRGALLSAPGSLQAPASGEAGYTPASFQPAMAQEPGTVTQAPADLYDRIASKYPEAPAPVLPMQEISNLGHGPAPAEPALGKANLQARRIDPNSALYNFSQLFNTFIVFQSDSEMFIADQHTVHERLNYEKLMQGLREKKLEVQPLLVPVTVELSAKEAQVLKNNQETLMELGMEVAPFGGNTFLVRSVPADLAGKNLVTLLKDLVDDLAAQDAAGIQSTNRLDQARERAATFLSCRSAVMAGDRLNEEQMRGLIDRMRQANLPFTCPHGRPTILSIPLSDLYRRFDRH
ncbi:MAG TPA: DNA mismatch repair endonuclease MutL [bacterium]|nr:DNA mismatch repair endonuclease MutL [bacterium]